MKLIHRWTPSLHMTRSLLVVGLVVGGFAACSEPTAPTPKPTGSLSVVSMPNLRAEDISADGKTVVLTDVESATSDIYFYDVATGATTLQAAAGVAPWDFATGISNGRRVSAFHGQPEVAGLWEQAAGWTDLGNVYPTGCEYDDVTHQQNQSSGWDIDSAGHNAVGLLWNACNGVAFLWTDASGAGSFVALDLLGSPYSGDPNPPTNRATTISDDGSTIGGFAQDTAVVSDGAGGFFTVGVDRRPTLWTSNGAGTMIPDGGVFTDDCPGEVLALAGNGSMAAGVWCNQAFLWSAATGVVNLTPSSSGYAQAVALNGQLVFGTSGGGFDPAVPFVWTQAGGVRSLIDIAAANGITIPANYSWGAVVAASADGTIVVGTVYDYSTVPFATSYTVVLKMPVSAYGL